MKRTLFVVTLISTFFLFFAGNDDQTTNKSSAIPFIKVQNYDKAEATIMRYYKNDFKTINNKDVKIFLTRETINGDWFTSASCPAINTPLQNNCENISFK